MDMKYFGVKLLDWSFQLQNVGAAISFHFVPVYFIFFQNEKW